jgi:hypothetical protein
VIVGNVVVCKKLTFNKFVHVVNAFCSIVVTDAGIEMEVRFTHFRNAPLPIDVSPSDNVTEVRIEHQKKALVPQVVIELGIVTDVRLLHFWNAETPNVVTEFGIVTEVRPEFWNADMPIEVIPSSIMIDFRVKQVWNALGAILVTLYVRPVIMSVILLGIVIAPVALWFKATVAVTKSSVV